MKKKLGSIGISKERCVTTMAENLAVLRAKLGMNQEDLADMVGVTRQTISAIESGSRVMSWTFFLSLMFIFSQNSDTKVLMSTLGIYTEELEQFFIWANPQRIK